MSLGLESQLEQIYKYVPAPSIDYLFFVKKRKDYPVAWGGEYYTYYQIFDDLARSFYFNEEINKTTRKYRKEGFVYYDDCKEIDPTGIKNVCLDLAKKINNIIPSVMDHNLKLVWERLRYLRPDIFPEKESLDEMRSFLSSQEFKKKDDIKILDLTRSEIQILPPEILNFSNLHTIYLVDSKLGTPPYILDAFEKYVHVEMEDTGYSYTFDSLLP